MSLTEPQENLFWIFTRFNKGKNPEFDNFYEKWEQDSKLPKEESTYKIDFLTHVNNWIKETNSKYSYSLFCEKLKNRKVSIRFLFEPYQIIKGGGLFLFNLTVFLYKFSPFIIFPIIAVLAKSWWPLGGILVSIYSYKTAAKSVENISNYMDSLTKILLIYTGIFIPIIILWIIFGFQHYIFWPFAIFYGYNCFMLAEKFQVYFGLKTLLTSPSIFNDIIQKNLIRIEENATDVDFM